MTFNFVLAGHVDDVRVQLEQARKQVATYGGDSSQAMLILGVVESHLVSSQFPGGLMVTASGHHSEYSAVVKLDIQPLQIPPKAAAAGDLGTLWSQLVDGLRASGDSGYASLADQLQTAGDLIFGAAVPAQSAPPADTSGNPTSASRAPVDPATGDVLPISAESALAVAGEDAAAS